MKKKLYSRTSKIYKTSNSEDLLRVVDNNGGKFTAEEHAYVNERGLPEHFESKEKLLRYYLSQNYHKLAILGFLIGHIHSHKSFNCLSLGAGPCVLEYLLKRALPSYSNVIATDFDTFLIEKAKWLFPEIIAEVFDFAKDDIVDFGRSFDFSFDITLFLNSAYVMEDSEFVRIFRGLKEFGVEHIIDVHGGYMDTKAFIKNLMLDIFQIRKSNFIRKLLSKSQYNDQWRGKFHGYSRNRSELRRLYNRSGFKVTKEVSLGTFKYVAILS